MARILVLEDEPLISMMVEGWLTELAHETVGPASSVAGALDLLKATRPDAAILDIMLRDETSYPVAHALARVGIPFAFTTGKDVEDVQGQFKNVRLLQKPFDFAGVKETIDTLLDRAGEGSAAPSK